MEKTIHTQRANVGHSPIEQKNQPQMNKTYENILRQRHGCCQAKDTPIFTAVIQIFIKIDGNAIVDNKQTPPTQLECYYVKEKMKI